MQRIAYTLFLVLFVSMSTTPAFAAISREQLDLESRGDFIISPGKTEIVVDPGTTETRNLTITNRTGGQVTFALDIEDFKGSREADQTVVLLGSEEGPYSLRNFIEPEIREITLEQGERASIPVSITIPEDAEPRGYYGAVVVTNAPQVEKRQEENGGASAQIVSRIASLMLVRVSGDVTEEGELSNFDFLGPEQKIFQSKPDGFELQFENTGNVHLVPYGQILIKNMFGATVELLPVNAFFALPDSIRYQEIQWSSDRFLLGRYTAEAQINKGYDDVVDTATLVFWVIPLKIVVPVVLGILLFILLLYYVLTRFEFKKKL